ncbi:hypothetical protein ABK040_010073 [Willaertia magna]
MSLENCLKKRKLMKEKEENKFISIDILYEIVKYFNNIKDFINLSRINKYSYENLLINNLFNNLFHSIIESQYINQNEFILTNNLPNYLFEKLKYLNISLTENNLNILKQFKNINKLNLFYSEPSKFLNNNLITDIRTNKDYNTILESSLLKLKDNLTSLTVEDCKLKDNVIKDFVNLTFLKIVEIDFSFFRRDFYFTGKCLQNFKQLTYLYIYDNSIVKDLYLKDLINLQELHLPKCTNITGKYFYRFKNLEILNVTENKIDDCFLDNIVKITNLKRLSISNEKSNYFFYKLNSSFLRKMTNLEYLDIICDSTLDKDFCNLKNLKNLIVYSGKENKKIGNCFNYLNNLEELKCDLNIINDLKCLQKIKRLKIKKLSDNIKDEDLKYLTNIIEIKINESVIGEFLLNLLNLEKLTIMESLIKDEYFINLKNLQKLSLSDCSNISGECFNSLQNLKKLKLLNINTIFDNHLISLKKLQKLKIFYNNTITGECLKYFNHLKELYLNKTFIKEEYLEDLINIEKLQMQNCPCLVKGKFLLNMKQLRYLIIGEEWLFEGFYNFNDILELKRLISKEEKSLQEITKDIIEAKSKTVQEY